VTAFDVLFALGDQRSELPVLNIGSAVWFLVYIGIFTPISFVFRLAFNDPLNLKRSPASKTYWEIRRNSQFRPMSSKY
jgi:hypothetical protein